MLKKVELVFIALSAAFVCIVLGIFIGKGTAQTLTVIPSDHPATVSESGKFDLNTATAAQLEMLPGIGPVLAQSIITYREEHGYFTSTNDLLLVPGIGAKRLNEILDYITIGGTYEDSCS